MDKKPNLAAHFWVTLFKPNLWRIHSVSLFLFLLGFACSSPEERAEELTVFKEVGDPISDYPKEPQAPAIAPDEIEEETLDSQEVTQSDDSSGEVIEGEIVLGQTTLLSSEVNQTSPILSNLPEHDPSTGYELLRYSSLTNFTYEIDWEKDGLAFDFSAYANRVPRDIRSLSNQKVALEGFMVPTVVDEENLVKEFLLMPDQLSCCFGQAPEANGWVVARSQKGVEVSMDRVIRVLGKLTVEERWDEEFFVGLYHLECDQLVDSAP
jgi:hypothetical protein